MNFCMKTRFAMYYLCQHQFSQLALLTEQILLSVYGQDHAWFSTSGYFVLWRVPQGIMHIIQVSGFTRRSHLPFIR